MSGGDKYIYTGGETWVISGVKPEHDPRRL